MVITPLKMRQYLFSCPRHKLHIILLKATEILHINTFRRHKEGELSSMPEKITKDVSQKCIFCPNRDDFFFHMLFNTFLKFVL